MTKLIEKIVREYSFDEIKEVYVSCRNCKEKFVSLLHAQSVNRDWKTYETFITEYAEFMVYDDDVICGCGLLVGIKINQLFLLSKKYCELLY